jgi:hypothetical protein
MYGYESFVTLTSGRLHYKLQIRPLVRESAPRRQAWQLSGKRKERFKNLVMGPKGVPDTKTDRPTDSHSQHQLNSAQLNSWGVQGLRLAISKGPNRVGVSLPSPEEGNRLSFGNIVFYSF